MPRYEDVVIRAGSLRAMTGLTEQEFEAQLPGDSPQIASRHPGSSALLVMRVGAGHGIMRDDGSCTPDTDGSSPLCADLSLRRG